jgi:aminopeptidase N
LEAARRAAGAAAFDAALRCYVAKNAWRIVVPSDLKTALEKLPAAIAVLRQAGALR